MAVREKQIRYIYYATAQMWNDEKAFDPWDAKLINAMMHQNLNII